MTFWLFVLLYSAPSLVESARDPVDGWFATDDAARNYDCTPLSTEQAVAVAPGEVPAPPARGDFLNRRAVICRERLMPAGIRRAQDDAILSNLRGIGAEMAGLVDTLAPLRGRTWLVESFHPDPRVAAKISFAVKNGLIDQGQRVSDRAPTLTAGDLEVIGGLPASQAYAVACARYAMNGALSAEHALLAVVLRDPRETLLHAGICADGLWRWLQ